VTLGPSTSDVESICVILRAKLCDFWPRLAAMPLVNVFCSATAPDTTAKKQFLVSLSSLIAREVGKPESYVMTNLVPQCDMTFAGTFEPACYVEVKNIGKFKPEQTQRMSAKVSELIGQSLGISKSRIYIEFSDATGYLWGYDGSTFG
jgi:phenylpyruvate tautomerase